MKKDKIKNVEEAKKHAQDVFKKDPSTIFDDPRINEIEDDGFISLPEFSKDKE